MVNFSLPFQKILWDKICMCWWLNVLEETGDSALHTLEIKGEGQKIVHEEK